MRQTIRLMNLFFLFAWQPRQGALSARFLLPRFARGLLACLGMLTLFAVPPTRAQTETRAPVLAPTQTSAPAEWIQQAQAAYEHAEYRRAETCAAMALHIFRRGNYREGIATAQDTRGQALQALGKFRQARACYEEALGIREQLRNAAGQAHLLEMLSGLAQHAGDDARAERLLARSETLRLGLSDTVGVALCERNRGIVAAEQGRYAVAEARYRRCLQLVKSLHKPEIEAHVHALQGALLRDQGHLEPARALLTGSLRFWEQRKHPRWIAGMQRHLALTAFYADRLPEAEKRLRTSLAEYRSVEDTCATAETQIWLARVVSRQGQHSAAAALVKQAMPILQEQGARLAIARAWELSAEMKAAAAPGTALSLLQRAAVERAKLKYPMPPVERRHFAHLRRFLRSK